MECGEIDLAHMLQRQRGSERDGTLSESFICMYWQQMLAAVNAIHEARVIHADLKPANFLCVQGSLKLIDFGIAKQSSADTTKIARDSQVGTVNYMSPETITCEGDDSSAEGQFKLGRASDVWSLGCLLYQMVYGHTPFSHLRTIYQKLQAVASPHEPAMNHGLSMNGSSCRRSPTRARQSPSRPRATRTWWTCCGAACSGSPPSALPSPSCSTTRS